LIGEFDAATRTYKMRSFDNQGNFTTMECHLNKDGTLQIAGDNMRSTLTFHDNNNMSAQWERSEDGKNWMPWIKMTFSKVSAK
jgi:hypothetical protein